VGKDGRIRSATLTFSLLGLMLGTDCYVLGVKGCDYFLIIFTFNNIYEFEKIYNIKTY
jgi:hypothetical protein